MCVGAVSSLSAYQFDAPPPRSAFLLAHNRRVLRPRRILRRRSSTLRNQGDHLDTPPLASSPPRSTYNLWIRRAQTILNPGGRSDRMHVSGRPYVLYHTSHRRSMYCMLSGSLRPNNEANTRWKSCIGVGWVWHSPDRTEDTQVMLGSGYERPAARLVVGYSCLAS